MPNGAAVGQMQPAANNNRRRQRNRKKSAGGAPNEGGRQAVAMPQNAGEVTYEEIQAEICPIAHEIISGNGGLMPLSALALDAQIRELLDLMPGGKKKKFSSILADYNEYFMMVPDENNQMQIATAEGFETGKVKTLRDGRVVLANNAGKQKQNGPANLPKLPGKVIRAAGGRAEQPRGQQPRGQAAGGRPGQQRPGQQRAQQVCRPVPVKKDSTKKDKRQQNQQQREQNKLERDERRAANIAKNEERVQDIIARGEDPDICWDNVEGNCRRGDRCKWKHI